MGMRVVSTLTAAVLMAMMLTLPAIRSAHASAAGTTTAKVPALACDVAQVSGSQAEMTRCAQQEYASQDKALNTVYQQYRARLGGEQQALLKKAQQAWLQYRDAGCAFESSSVKGGSAEAMVVTQCLAQKTAARVQELQRLSQCEEGDLSCPR